jgi:hypothetical protein
VPGRRPGRCRPAGSTRRRSLPGLRPRDAPAAVSEPNRAGYDARVRRTAFPPSRHSRTRSARATWTGSPSSTSANPPRTRSSATASPRTSATNSAEGSRLGWADDRVEFIDDDQGISGQSVENPPGCERRHQALGYRTPAQVCREARRAGWGTSAAEAFFRPSPASAQVNGGPGRPSSRSRLRRAYVGIFPIFCPTGPRTAIAGRGSWITFLSYPTDQLPTRPTRQSVSFLSIPHRPCEDPCHE